MSRLRRWWDARVLPGLVERACKSHAILAERQRWVPQAAGAVLEIGVGTGLNLPFYDAAQVTAVTAIDPSPALLARAQARAAAAAVPVELVEAAAGAMPFDAGRFDCALVTYTLCSVDDPGAALADVRRVLRPGGRLIFVEHGRSPDPRTYRWQRRLTPAWRAVGGNCHLDRDVAGLLRAAGYQVASLDAAHVDDGPRWMSYTFQGIARTP
ncbi:MAG: methyltransferase domain-containing protein [Kofleriaceae bacterium]